MIFCYLVHNNAQNNNKQFFRQKNNSVHIGLERIKIRSQWGRAGGGGNGSPRVSLFCGDTIWLLYLVPIISLDRKRTQFPAKIFFLGGASLLDRKPAQFSAKTFFLILTYF